MIKWLKRPIAFISAIAVAVGMVSDAGTMKVSAEEEGSATSSTVTFEATAGTAGSSDSEGYDKLIDGKYSSDVQNDWSKWCVVYDECDYFMGAYIIFASSEPISVKGYTIVTGNDNAEGGCENRNPLTWELYGSNEAEANSESGRESTSWESIHSVENDTVLQDENYTQYKYTIENPTQTKYQYFKLEITETKGSNVMQMSEFILDYNACEHTWEKGDTVAPTCTEEGYTLQTCSKCNEQEKIEIKPALGHDFNDNDTCNRCNSKGVALSKPAGEGTENNPYRISTRNELYWFAGLVSGDESVCTGGVTKNISANAVLTADIKVNSNLLSSLKYDKDGNVINGDSFSSWTPIGNELNSYTGTFDGQGFTVSGLYVNNTDSNTGKYVGLFGRVASGGKVSKVGVVDSYFNAYRFVGGVCGYNIGGNITECYNKGTVNGNDTYTGGVCGGNNSGTIQNCYNEGSVTGKDERTGGVCGNNEKATIINCYNTGKVVGNISGSGGVCGNNYTDGTIQNCYNIGTVSLSTTVEESAIGGVCGYNKSTITNCYFDSDKYNGTAVGGTGDGSNVSDNVLGKTTEQFNSGEVAYLLQDGQEADENSVKPEVWGQTLSENADTYPVLKKTGDEGNTVYTFTCGENTAYTNDSNLRGETQSHDFSAQTISDNAKISGATCTEKAKYYYSCTHCRAVEKNGEHVFEDGGLAEHTDENLDGKCDVCNNDFKTFEQLGKLITKVNQNLNDGKYANVQYTTASIDNLRKALVVANAITAQSLDTEVAAAYDNLLAASTVGENGLVAADHNIVIAFADTGAARGIAAGNGWYANGDTVTLKVTPSVGYTFSKWTTDTAGGTSVGTESTYTFTLGADSPDAYYAWLDQVKYTVTCRSVEGGTCSTDTEDGKYVYGQTAKVTATANENYEFVGWKDSYGTTVSTDNIYSFTVIGNTTLTPEFVKVKTDEGADITYVTVSFYHQSGKLLDSQMVVSGEGKITTTVNAPTKAGFDFLGWSAKTGGATAEDVVDFSNAIFSEDTSLYPVFAAKNITYTLTVNGQSEQKAPQSKVTVTADPIEGQQFAGWKNADGNIVSYDSTYTFIITGDTTLTSYYEPVNAVIEKTPTINMSAPVYEDINDNGKSCYKMTFYFDYTLPEDCKLIDIGTIKVKGSDLSSEGITLDTENVSQYSVLSKLGVDGQFYYSKSNYYKTGHTVAGYMIYEKSGIRYTVYSNAVYGIKEN
ncbi:MAG: GLUG motif-containing protein [Oscillospiraceae bacterium]|nr:GLUG motif-containing protein [Oscillospiraceae bacterium]